MKKLYPQSIIGLILLFLGFSSYAQQKFTVIPCETEQDVINIVDTVLLKGLKEKGFVSNITFQGNPIAVGRFYNGDSMGFKRGIIMTTGRSQDHSGPNSGYVG